MNILFFDTETTGLVKDWDNPGSAYNPRMVQIGLLLCSDSGRVLHTMGTMILPEGFEIPPVVENIHGISTEMATKHGLNLNDVLDVFMDLITSADLLVAHNLKFDRCVIEGELIRANKCACLDIKTYCTMLNTTDICMLPSKRNGYKWPKLSEAYQHFFKIPLEDAHDALTDVLACKRIFFEGLHNPARTMDSLVASVI